MMWVIALIFLVPGLLLLAHALRHLLQAWRSWSWPMVEATIEEARTLETDSEERAYKPEIRYTYTVGGQKYASDRVRIGWPLSASKRWAEALVTRYPAGTHVQACVHPNKAHLSVLERGFHAWLWISLLFACAILAVGLFLLFQAARIGAS